MAISGDRLAGRYALVAPIGAGGMATVWRAVDTRLDRPVAVKILRPSFAEDPAFVHRFDTEARLAASLQHPNIATVFDTGTDGPDRFIVMELVDGPTVAEILRACTILPAAAAAEVALAAANALAAAHAGGLVHRDVKPGNLIVGRDGIVRLTDFGIARALASSRTTVAGTILGSLPYLAPEQVRGEEATPAGDVYALGVVLFEMLTGRLPWTADTGAGLATARLTTPPARPSAVMPSLPPGTDDLLAPALALAAGDRYPGARAFAGAIDAWSRALVAEPGPAGSPGTLAQLAAMVPAAGLAASAASDADPDVATMDVPTLVDGPDAGAPRGPLRGRTRAGGLAGTSLGRVAMAAAAGMLALVAIVALANPGPPGGVPDARATPPFIPAPTPTPTPRPATPEAAPAGVDEPEEQKVDKEKSDKGKRDKGEDDGGGRGEGGGGNGGGPGRGGGGSGRGGGGDGNGGSNSGSGSGRSGRG